MRPLAFPLQSTPGIPMETTFLMQLWHPALISQCIKQSLAVQNVVRLFNSTLFAGGSYAYVWTC